MPWLPRTIRWSALPEPGDEFEPDWLNCRALLSEAASNDAVRTVRWHLRVFNADEFPGYGRLHYRLVDTALSMDA